MDTTTGCTVRLVQLCLTAVLDLESLVVGFGRFGRGVDSNFGFGQFDRGFDLNFGLGLFNRDRGFFRDGNRFRTIRPASRVVSGRIFLQVVQELRQMRHSSGGNRYTRV